MEGTPREGIHPDSVTFGDNLSTTDRSIGTPSSPPTGSPTSVTTGKGRVSGIQATIADGLQAGADALRQRRAAASTGSTGSSVTALVNDPAIAAVSDSLATGMQSGAEWLRDADMDKLKEGVEKQVKEHPARSLFVALGAGFLLGKVLRR